MTTEKLKKVNQLIYIVFLGTIVIFAMILILFVVTGTARAEDKPAATPVLTDAQKVPLLQAAVKVLEDQVANSQADNQILQAQLQAAQKAAAFTASRDAFFKQYEATFTAAGVKSADFDLNLSTLEFKAKAKADAKLAPPANPAKKK